MHIATGIIKRQSVIKVGRQLLAVLLLLLCACKKEKITDYPPGSNEQINTWLLDSLKRYYYWNESLPAKPDFSAAPQTFFAAVRNPADRFSYINIPGNPATDVPTSRGKYGFDYAVIRLNGSGQLIGVIKQVLQDSPASRAGLKRGDYILRINGKLLTEGNLTTLQTELLSTAQVSLGLGAPVQGNWQDAGTLNITFGATFEQPSISHIIESGNRKTGYLYIGDFNTGLGASLYSTFQTFKAAGITDLVLDLRYNAGGQVAEAAALCTMIAPGITYNTPFITYRGNKNGGVKTESFGTAATFDGTANFNQLQQYNLALSRVYILATGATASASEVVINNLKPYMQVKVIGQTTRGKDEASFRIYDARNPKQIAWEMHPIIYKLFNAVGNGGYSAGINPDIAADELASLPLLPLGDTNDPLLRVALAAIGVRTTVTNALVKKQQLNIAGTVLSDTNVENANHSILFTHH